MDAFEEVRNRALIYVLAYSGVRGSEVLADSRHDDRNGLRWSDVYLENSMIQVFGKSQDPNEEVGLTGQPSNRCDDSARLSIRLPNRGRSFPRDTRHRCTRRSKTPDTTNPTATRGTTPSSTMSNRSR